MPSNLLLRGKTYSARLFIPIDLRESVGRCEVVRTLKTGDRKQARMLLRKVQEVAERLFFYARVGMVDKGKLNALLQNYIEDGLRDWAANKGELKAQKFDLSETTAERYLTGAENNIAEQYRSVAQGAGRSYFGNENKEFIRTHARMLLEDNCLDVQGEDFDRFSDMFAKVYVKTQEELANREEGRHSYDYRQFVQGMFEEDQPVTMKQAIAEWMELKKAKGLGAGTYEMYEVNTGLALSFYGADYAVRKLNNRELLRFVQYEQARGIKNITLERRIRLIKDVVKLASANHGFTMPTYRIELVDDGADVLPYSAEELNELFVLLNDRRKVQDWKYWAVLIGLVGGLRREEVVSLRVKDIKPEGDIWYFDVVDSKTDAGIRYTPVSEKLIQLGFLDFVKERVESGEPYLLMCWLQEPKKAHVAVPADKYGDAFRNMIKKVALEVGDNEKKTLHSLRHNYSDALKQGGVRPDITDELCGHEHAPGSMRSIYDEKFGLGILAENLAKAKWECDFSLLRTWKG